MENPSAWYDEHAAAFDADTRDMMLDAWYAPFLGQIPRGGMILDAGCGAGRDAVRFHKRGYGVVGVDGSEPMLQIARQRAPRVTFVQDDLRTLDRYRFPTFDGVWAMASLLHMPTTHDLVSAVVSLRNTLRPGGVLCATFKYGDTIRREPDGRVFNDQTVSSIAPLLAVYGMEVLEARKARNENSRSPVPSYWTWVLAQRV